MSTLTSRMFLASFIVCLTLGLVSGAFAAPKTRGQTAVTHS